MLFIVLLCSSWTPPRTCDLLRWLSSFNVYISLKLLKVKESVCQMFALSFYLPIPSQFTFPVLPFPALSHPPIPCPYPSFSSCCPSLVFPLPFPSLSFIFPSLSFPITFFPLPFFLLSLPCLISSKCSGMLPVIRDRTNRPLLFWDRISNCTNLFQPNRTEPHTQICAAFALRHTRVFNRTSAYDSVFPHASQCLAPQLRIVAISTPFNWSYTSSMGKLYCPGNDCSRVWSAATSVVYSQKETTKGRR